MWRARLIGLVPQIEPGCGAPRCAWGQVAGTNRCRVTRAFTLADVSVSIAVIAVLLAILAPSLSMVREATRRVVCSSNVKQIGYGLVMFADDHRGNLPPSQFADKRSADSSAAPQHMQIVRIADIVQRWDGIGNLYGSSYLSAPGVFYCPSHHGSHPMNRYESNWPEGLGAITANYHFRGSTREGLTDLARIATRYPSIALLSDGLASRADYNHRTGCNFLRIDASVTWFADEGGQLANSLASLPSDTAALGIVRAAWVTLDEGNVNFESPQDPQGPP
ncbi:MAG: DUF1559 family PulG-like putative transporter [Phycisphaerales bacterium]